MASLLLASQLCSSSRAGVCPGHCHHSLIPASERTWTKGMLFLHPLLSVKPMNSLADPIRLSMALARDGMGGEVASGAVRILSSHPAWPKPCCRWGLGQVYFQELEPSR